MPVGIKVRFPRFNGQQQIVKSYRHSTDGAHGYQAVTAAVFETYQCENQRSMQEMKPMILKLVAATERI